MLDALAGERWCSYYNSNYDIDIRSLRYPGLISYKTEAGGGTTDYATDIYFDAIAQGHYECFIAQHTYLPFLFMPDAIEATVKLMQANRSRLSVYSSYNLGGFSQCPDDFYKEIKKHVPNFRIEYAPDFRQDIAASWPDSIDDQIARKDWGFSPQYDISDMTEVMLREAKLKRNNC